jgi:hypothetical protein
MFDRDYIAACDLGGKDVSVKIVKVVAGDLTGAGGRKAKKPIIYFEGKEKAFLQDHRCEVRPGHREVDRPDNHPLSDHDRDGRRSSRMRAGEEVKSIRWSTLKHMARSPQHYLYARDNPLPMTPAMRLGALAHWRLLGGRTVKPVVVYDGERRGNAWKEYEAKNADSEIYTSKEFSRADEMVAAVLADKRIRTLLLGTVEQRIHTKICDVDVAGTPDVHNDDIVDFKFTADASLAVFPRHARRMGWHAQLDWYAEMVQASTGQRPKRCILVGVETKPPYAVQPYILTESAVALGRRLWRGLLEQVLVCESSGNFPGYQDGFADLDIFEDELTLTIDGEEIEV